MAELGESPSAPEDALIRQASRGHRPSFSKLVLGYQGGLRAFCARYGPDLETADDLAQEVFIRAFQSLGRFQIGTDFGKWLRGIARHLLADALRREAREARVLMNVPHAFASEQMAGRLVSDEAGQDTGRQLKALSRCLEGLDGGSRDLVRSHYEEGLSAAEISRRWGKGLSGVRMQLLRIRRGLRRCVDLRLREATT
jgi:RNA polymerase sigma-70 factor (ECF subfamily)